MAKKRVKITECVFLKKTVEINAGPDDDLEVLAREEAYKNLPDYDKAGWELINSEGCIFTLLKEE